MSEGIGAGAFIPLHLATHHPGGSISRGSNSAGTARLPPSITTTQAATPNPLRHNVTTEAAIVVAMWRAFTQATCRGFSSHSLLHHQSPHQSPHVVMPAHHMSVYLLFRQETRRMETHPQGNLNEAQHE